MPYMDTVDISSLGLGSFDFTPDWAKKDAGVVVGKSSFERSQAESPRREFKPGKSDRKPFDRTPFDKKGGARKPFERRERFAERPKPLDVEVKILPEPKALGTIIRKLQQDPHAYKLKDLAYFFLDNPSSVLLKITPKKHSDGTAAEPLKFFQCGVCGFAATSEAEVVAHILSTHLGEYYESKVVDCEPPKGNFNCVAKCGLSGVLLGPPNIHEFNATVREMIRTRYPDMSEEDYRSRIVMVREAEAIEEWRQSAVKKTVFTAKNAGEGAREMSRSEAEGEFRRQILPSLVSVPKNLMISVAVVSSCPMKSLQRAVEDALRTERRAPYSMCFALRGALHHRKMHFFRANDSRGTEFVTGIELKPFDSAHAIPELAKIADFIAANPCLEKSAIVSDAEGEKHLQWLVSTGHVVAFTNGVYSAVEKFPKYGPQWRKKKEAPAEKPAENAEVENKEEE